MSEDESGDQRRPWTEGPDVKAPPQSWLLLDDDELLHRIETLAPASEEENEDDRLLEVVASDRHFFIRQEAAKRVHDRDRLFDFEDDRHVGQILVRHLTRREDVTYLERLSKRSRHVEVRSAAQVQLARLWHRLDAPPAKAASEPAPIGLPESAVPAPAAPSPAAPSPAAPAPAAPAPAAPAPATPTAGSVATVAATPAAPLDPITSAALEKGGVDSSLLAWAVHFLVAPTWTDVGTRRTRELLMQTRRELLSRHPTLVLFEITPDAHVTANLDAGPRLPSDSVRAVAAWMVAYRQAVRSLAPVVTATSVRAATTMVADALRDAGFYTACDELEGKRA